MKRLLLPVKLGLLVTAVAAFVLAAASGQRTEAYPSFSLDAVSISAAPGDVLDPVGGAPFPGPTPPGVVATVITAAALGIPGGNIDGLSYGDDFPWGVTGIPHFYEFSVDNNAMGGPWHPPFLDSVLTQGITGEGGAGPDIFVTAAGLPDYPTCNPGANFNYLLYDGDGFTTLAGPVLGVGGLFDLPINPPLDNIDAYEAGDVSAVDYLTAGAPVPPPPPSGMAGGDGIPDGAVFFTVDPATAAGLGVSPADVLVTDPGSPTGWGVYAPALWLGLNPGDDVDALLVADSVSAGPGPGGAVRGRKYLDPADVVAFSLAPGSPSLGWLPSPCPGIPGPNSASDVWWVSPFFTGGAPTPLVAGEDLGLCTMRSCGTDDNLDGIDISWGPGGDTDSDGLPDGLEPWCGTAVGPSDSDGDGILDGTEAAMSNLGGGPCAAWPSPAVADSDGDGLYDGWELAYFTPYCNYAPNPSVADALADPDGDSIANIGEQTLGTSPCSPDPLPPAPETPSFTLAGPGPAPNTGLSPADILGLNPLVGGPPVVGIPCASLWPGILTCAGPVQDDIDSLSYGTDTPALQPATPDVAFSVTADMWPEGLAGSAVFTESTGCGVDQSYSDEFSASFPLPPPGMGGTNTLVLDENGLADFGCGLGYPLGTQPVPGDDMDGLVDLPPTFVDDGSITLGCGPMGGIAGDGIPDKPVYATFDPASPLLGMLAGPFNDGAAIFGFCGGAAILYAAGIQLGLIGVPMPNCAPPMCDDIDAMVLSDTDGAGGPGDGVWGPGDELWFSLAPNSPTLGVASESDILYVNGSMAAPVIWYFGGQIGLNTWLPAPGQTSPVDDLDALKGHLESPCDPAVSPNSDSLGIPNGADIPNPSAANPDKDALTDACDNDDDNDGPDNNDPVYTDSEETAGCGFGPTVSPDKDTDGDRAIDGYECLKGTNPNSAASRPVCAGGPDSDGDGIKDCVEELGYGTSPYSIDSDGDSGGLNNGCRDDKQIVDVNGDGQANILDIQPIARINLLTSGVYDPVSKAVADINKDGANNILDVQLAVLNSTLVEPHDPC
jgi:hypothetical protein